MNLFEWLMFVCWFGSIIWCIGNYCEEILKELKIIKKELRTLKKLYCLILKDKVNDNYKKVK